MSGAFPCGRRLIYLKGKEIMDHIMLFITNSISFSTVRKRRLLAAAVLVLACAVMLSSCGVMHQVFGKKVNITFDANGGIVTGSGVDTDGPSDPKTYKARCIAGDELTDFTASRDLYDFLGWFTEAEGGMKVTECPEEDATFYAHWESANKDRTVTISGISASQPGSFSEDSSPDSGSAEQEDAEAGTDDEAAGAEEEGGNKDAGDEEKGGELTVPKSAAGKPFFASMLRISPDDDENEVTVSFTLDKWFGQDVYFVDKKGGLKQQIEVDGDSQTDLGDSITVSCTLPDRKWMDRKEYSYYIQSMENEHVDESEITELRIVLEGQYKDFDKPVEGSMAWYGGPDDAPDGRAGVIIATDDDNVYALGVDEETGEAETGGTPYKWKKEDVMINLADVRTDIVYDIYNAYSSRFFPIKGKALYSDNGKKGLKRYGSIDKEDAVHKNRKTGQTTFMVPVQWDFAMTVATAQAKAREMGVTLYIVDSFRPMYSVGPVVKAVDDLTLLTEGGSSAHNFGMAVDTGWQLMNEDGELTGEPYDKNLQVLNKKKAVQGPRGNEHEVWWEGVNKLQQEWWHYGDSFLDADYREQAKRVGSLYVNQKPCASVRRSKLHS